jgi:dihydropyrimidinase
MADFAMETRSAVIGGVTTTIVFHRATSNYGSDFQNAISKAARLSHMDFSYHLQIMSEEQIANIPRYLNEFGISSFKFNMGYKGKEAEEKDIFELNDGLLYEGLAEIGRMKGLVACIHAENSELIAFNTAKLRRQGRNDLIAWAESRPVHAEAESIARVLYFSRLTGCPLYIAHMTTAEGLRLIREHRKNGGAAVFIETCPQYLTHHMHSPIGPEGRFIPPLRTEVDNEALWQGLANGDIDTIGIDQGTRKVDSESVSVWERKTSPREAVTALPMLITEGFHKRGLKLDRIAALTSANPAAIFNLYPRKGTLQVGSDADIAIVDINREKMVTREMIQSASDFSIYEGWSLKGWPVITICRGRVAMQDGEPVSEPGWGKFVARRPKM